MRLNLISPFHCVFLLLWFWWIYLSSVCYFYVLELLCCIIVLQRRIETIFQVTTVSRATFIYLFPNNIMSRLNKTASFYYLHPLMAFCRPTSWDCVGAPLLDLLIQREPMPSLVDFLYFVCAFLFKDVAFGDDHSLNCFQIAYFVWKENGFKLLKVVPRGQSSQSLNLKLDATAKGCICCDHNSSSWH